jgi:glycosyltransferase involved in cell wall biosynthesis
MTTVAVVMATYNGEPFIAEQLESIARQTRPPDVLVISDDGSSDGTWRIAGDFAASARFDTKLVRGPEKGLAHNFWEAAQLVDTDLIAWADQDDIWMPTKLARCETVLKRRAAGFVSHAAITVDRAGRRLGPRYPNYWASRSLSPLAGDPWHVPSGFASMFRRSLIVDVPFDQRPRSHQTMRPINHDHVVSLRAFACCERIELADDLAHYRQHGGNAAGDPTTTGVAAIRETFRPRAHEFTELATIAEAYGAFLALLPDTAASEPYFASLADRCRDRVGVYAEGRTGSRCNRASAQGLLRRTLGRQWSG